MAANRRRGRRTAVIATAAAAFALTAGLLTGCEFDDSVDCLANADDITAGITAIHKAGADAVEDPARTEDSIGTIEKNLDRINGLADDGSSDDGKVGEAVDRLRRAVEDYNQDILDGERPDSAEIDKAASELRDVCTS
ncbi:MULTISPECIES: hypothetical protein [unclassified Streptomyces]|uniref:hypothetical protein n=1 Tax=unclassified Streptomyces TaxID=2593676 RepID=UPI00070B6186|nr:hypothetical protein [Streptomyces sp. Root1310]KQX78196.1 hypothetical protein ASD48_35955 [Streptomyces sp. Root1310]